MRHGGTVPSIAAVLLVGALLATPAAAQPAPFGPRDSLIITEICPVPAPGESPWIELYNATADPVKLSGLRLRTDESLFCEAPGETAASPLLGAGEFLLVSVDAPTDSDIHLKRLSSGLVLHCPVALAGPWVPNRGELALYGPRPGSATEGPLVDYVAWGAPGSDWSEAARKVRRWLRDASIPLAEGFGVYDPSASLAAGATIGLYPGSTVSSIDDWTLFDPDETSAGGANRVPRPKAFTLADGAVIGSQSFAVAWPKRKGDEWYRFEVASDETFHTLVSVATSVVPVFRLGDGAQTGQRYYRATAFSAGARSEPSLPREILLRSSTCDWPLPPTPWEKNHAERLREWIIEPKCPPERDCAIISTMKFKFQRKDTPLSCSACLASTDDDPLCGPNSPHPYCYEVSFSVEDGEQGPGYGLCAGGQLSPLCGVWPKRFREWLPPDSRPSRSGPFEVYSRALPDIYSNSFSARTCAHGSDYCWAASISMIASAYGACLSQDVLQREAGKGVPLGQRHGARGKILCNRGIGEEVPGQTCSKMLKAALGREVEYSPLPPTSVVDLRTWIDRNRPIMSKAEWDHVRVVAGYCIEPADSSLDEDSPTAWVYVFDPGSGPRAETFESWRDSSSGTWISPPVWCRLLTPGCIVLKADDPQLWQDSDSDGVPDFEDASGTPGQPMDPAPG